MLTTINKRPNFVPLSPVSFLKRSSIAYSGNTAIVFGEHSITYSQLYERCRLLASSLVSRGITPGATVSVIADNIPAMIELHFAVPMVESVLNCINTRLDAKSIAFILDHSSAEMLFVDSNYLELAEKALAICERKPEVIRIVDGNNTHRSDDDVYETLIKNGEIDFIFKPLEEETNPITLNYTSGTTGNPKGVLSSHRAAYLNAIGNLISLGLTSQSRYLWTLPLFHCNGWCHAWAVSAAGACHICLRKPTPENITKAIERSSVTHFSAAPVVLASMSQYFETQDWSTKESIKVMTGGSSPTPTLINSMESRGFELVHLYGLSESFGPVAICETQSEWNELDQETRYKQMANQGINHITAEEVAVVDSNTMQETPCDGVTSGEVMLRSNSVMLGYLKNDEATAAAFKNGGFLTGDIAVKHPNGYIELKDRKKDVIISGGENISSLEIEAILCKHPAVLEAAVVAMPHPKWGESPCAFIHLKNKCSASENEILEFCRDELAHYKVPKAVIFGTLAKTGTGKILKYELRQQAKHYPFTKPG